jgi:hypothetical protein
MAPTATVGHSGRLAYPQPLDFGLIADGAGLPRNLPLELRLAVVAPGGNVATDVQHVPHHFKEKAVEEFKLYWLVFFFLAVMFGAFNTYRRLILGEVGVNYGHYGAGLIEAAIIAKVILIGDAMKLGRWMEAKYPLIYTVLVKSVLFGLLVAVFNMIEHAIEGLVHGETWALILAHPFPAQNTNEILARTVVMIVTFIPFFAVWEAGRVLGRGKLSEIFLRHRRAFG